MKKIKLALLAMSTVFLMASCGNKPDSEKDAEVGEAETIEETVETATSYVIDTEASSIRWEGFKSIGYSHWGTISLSEGSIAVDGDAVTGGSFTIDMNTMVNDDLEDAEKNADLIGHLTSTDFFNTAEFPTASFEIASVDAGSVTGNLTIKGITKSITFPAEMSMADGVMTATADFNFDRTQWDISYGSKTLFEELGDDFILDDINMQLNLVANAQ